MDVRRDIVQLRSAQADTGLLFELPHLGSGDVGKWIISGSGSVRIESKDRSGQMRVVGRGTAELIIRLSGTGWTGGQILQLSTAAIVTDLEIKFAVRAK